MHNATIPSLFLVSSLFGATLTLNACWPLARRGRGVIVAFFAGWLVSELPAHHLLWQALFSIGFILMGAMEHWQGWAAMAVNAISWLALAYLLFDARRVHVRVETALCDGLGAILVGVWDNHGQPCVDQAVHAKGGGDVAANDQDGSLVLNLPGGHIV